MSVAEPTKTVDQVREHSTAMWNALTEGARNAVLGLRTSLDWTYVVKLNRLNLLVIAILAATMLDWIFEGSMREALRAAVTDRNYVSLGAMAVGVALLAFTVRFLGELIALVLMPDLLDSKEIGGRAARNLPRWCALLAGLIPSLPLLFLLMQNEWYGGVTLGTSARDDVFNNATFITLLAGVSFFVIGFLIANLGPTWPAPARTSARDAKTTMSGVRGVSIFFFVCCYIIIPFAVAVFAVSIWSVSSGVGALWDNDEFRRHAAQHYLDSPMLTVLHLISLVVAVFLVIRVGGFIFLQIAFEILRLDENSLVMKAIPYVVTLLGIAVSAAIAVIINNSGALIDPANYLDGYTDEAVRLLGTLFLVVGLTASVYGLFGMHFRLTRYVNRVESVLEHVADRFVSLDDRSYAILAGLGVAAYALVIGIGDGTIDPIFTGTAVGAPTVLQFWAFCAVIIFTPFVFLAHIARIPALTLILFAAVLFSMGDLNDNHAARTLKADAGATRYGETLSLAKWLETRPDKGEYAHYPVLIVATEGGGSRAAYYTANILAALQDMCPAFAQHVLAISSVSGGSVGAATFAALTADLGSAQAKAVQCKLNPAESTFRRKARSVLDVDLLAPLLNAMLLSDSVQRVWPIPLEKRDRARALEGAFERAWDQECGDGCTAGRLAAPLSGLFTNDATKNVVPHLLLNTTEVDTGLAIPIATARLCVPAKAGVAGAPATRPTARWCSGQNQVLQDQLPDGADFPVSTAAFVSARFPYLTPPARVEDQQDRVHRYVDGGYFENSGSLAATRLLQTLLTEKIAYRNTQDPALEAAVRNAEIFVILVRSTPICTRLAPHLRCAEDPEPGIGGGIETLSPIKALFATRSARTEYARQDVRQLADLLRLVCKEQQTSGPGCTIGSDQGAGGPVKVIEIEFQNAVGTEIPMTWKLSRLALAPIEEAVDSMTKGHWLPVGSRTEKLSRSLVAGPIEAIVCALSPERPEGLTQSCPGELTPIPIAVND